MRKQTTLRDNLYKTLDDLIKFTTALNRDLPAISLNSAQFQIFQDFNEKDHNGSYHYRGIEVKKV